MNAFRAFVLRQSEGKTAGAFENPTPEALPSGDVLIRVACSSLNYKDGLAVTGKPGVARTFPMVPGIDLAGTVLESSAPEFQAGQEVVVTGCGTSEIHWGGYAQMARMKAEWVIPKPSGMSLQQCMAVGTAGFTAMQSVMVLEQHGLAPGGREVVVTGAGGGVGSVAIAILARLGYRAVASSGRAELHDYLKSLGAADIIDRSVLSAASNRPMETERWAAAIDNVGGDTLAGLIRTMAVHGSIASCGVAGGAKVATTVFPFILRGVNLLGIDSVRPDNAYRRAVWKRVERDLPLEKLDAMTEVRPLSEIVALGEKILAGQTRGRVVIDVNA
jgi:acrylyl-CoA reductase (NADPH)